MGGGAVEKRQQERTGAPEALRVLGYQSLRDINYIPATLLSLENEENVIEGIVLAAIFYHVRQYRQTMIASGGKFSQVDRPYIAVAPELQMQVGALTPASQGPLETLINEVVPFMDRLVEDPALLAREGG